MDGDDLFDLLLDGSDSGTSDELSGGSSSLFDEFVALNTAEPAAAAAAAAAAPTSTSTLFHPGTTNELPLSSSLPLPTYRKVPATKRHRLPKSTTEEERSNVRKEKNRKAAQELRDRKREYQHELDRRATDAETEVQTLSGQMEAVSAENAQLRSELNRLRAELAILERRAPQPQQPPQLQQQQQTPVQPQPHQFNSFFHHSDPIFLFPARPNFQLDHPIIKMEPDQYLNEQQTKINPFTTTTTTPSDVPPTITPTIPELAQLETKSALVPAFAEILASRVQTSFRSLAVMLLLLALTFGLPSSPATGSCPTICPAAQNPALLWTVSVQTWQTVALALLVSLIWDTGVFSGSLQTKLASLVTALMPSFLTQTQQKQQQQQQQQTCCSCCTPMSTCCTASKPLSSLVPPHLLSWIRHMAFQAASMLRSILQKELLAVSDALHTMKNMFPRHSNPEDCPLRRIREYVRQHPCCKC